MQYNRSLTFMENDPMRSTPAFLITDSGITLFIEGQHHAISQDHINYGKILGKLTSLDFDGLVELLDVRASVRKFLKMDKEFSLTNDLIEFRGRPFSSAVTDKVLNLVEAGNDASALFNFLRLVRQNPSAVAQEELLLFCVANNFMITTDGYILAYKSVNENYTAIHDNKTPYKPFVLMSFEEQQQLVRGVTVGSVTVTVEGDRTVAYMSRNAVDDRRENTCSYGLHFASYDYASTWAGQDGKRLLVLGVSPADVVSIPNDYNNQKGRASKVTVYSELAVFAPLPPKPVYDFTPADDVDEDVDRDDWNDDQYTDDDWTAGWDGGESESASNEVDILLNRYNMLGEDFDAATRAHRPRKHILTERNQVKTEILDLCNEYGFSYPVEVVAG